MAETKQDRVDVQIEKVHSIETLLTLKPDMTLAEYLKLEIALLEKLQHGKQYGK